MSATTHPYCEQSHQSLAANWPAQGGRPRIGSGSTSRSTGARYPLPLTPSITKSLSMTAIYRRLGDGWSI
jgi:hypothetical protein